MSGECDLATLLRTLKVRLAPDTYLFATLPDRALPEGLRPLMRFEEAEGTTLILRREEAIAHGIAGEFPCRMLTLDVHSSLEAVGFIAHIGRVLAEAGLGVNPVAGFYHDHLFLPEDRAEEALELLEGIAQST